MDNNENTIRIQTQLTLREYVRLYCKHNYRKLCVDCMSGIWGDVSGISGVVSGISGDVSGISGVVSGISGDVSGILRILQEEIDAHKSEK